MHQRKENARKTTGNPGKFPLLTRKERHSENLLKPPSLSPNHERKIFPFNREENPTFSTFDNILSKRQHIQEQFRKKKIAGIFQ
jgi:hypothetical protein